MAKSKRPEMAYNEQTGLCRSETPAPVISDADAVILRAYHAASLRDRGLVDQILQAYIVAENTGKSAG